MYGKWPYQVCKKDKDGRLLPPKGNYREIAFFMTIYFIFFNSPETAPNMTLATKFAQDVLHYALFASFDRRSPMGNRVKRMPVRNALVENYVRKSSTSAGGTALSRIFAGNPLLAMHCL